MLHYQPKKALAIPRSWRWLSARKTSWKEMRESSGVSWKPPGMQWKTLSVISRRRQQIAALEKAEGRLDLSPGCHKAVISWCSYILRLWSNDYFGEQLSLEIRRQEVPQSTGQERISKLRRAFYLCALDWPWSLLFTSTMTMTGTSGSTATQLQWQ